MRLVSWNVNGIRAIQKKGFLEWFRRADPDILALQETKASQGQLGSELLEVPGFHSYWSSAQKKGYSGVGVQGAAQHLVVDQVVQAVAAEQKAVE